MEDFSRYSVWSNIKSIEVLSDEEKENLLQEHFFSSGFAFELSPWEEVLGYEVDEHTVLEFGTSGLPKKKKRRRSGGEKFSIISFKNI